MRQHVVFRVLLVCFQSIINDQLEVGGRGYRRFSMRHGGGGPWFRRVGDRAKGSSTIGSWSLGTPRGLTARNGRHPHSQSPPTFPLNSFQPTPYLTPHPISYPK